MKGSLNIQIERYRDIFFKEGAPYLPKVLERGVYKSLKDQDPLHKYKGNRFLDLLSLLKTFYWIEKRNPSIYLNNKNFATGHQLDTFRIYISKVVIANFPFKEFKIGKHFKSANNSQVFSTISVGEYAVEPEKWDLWIDELISASTRRASWKAKLNLSEMNESELIYTRALRLFDLACLLEETYKIHISSSDMRYGSKLVICGFIGQYLIRQYPFKDYVFYSKEYQNRKSSIYEHWTPMAHFAKIITFPTERLKDFNIDMTRTGWFEMLYYYYRTVYIDKSQDLKLNENDNKTFRKKDAYNKIELNNAELFDKIHNLEFFYSRFSVNQNGLKERSNN